MKKEDIIAALEAVKKSGITVNGDLVLEKNVDYEVANVENGGIGIQINHGMQGKNAEPADEEQQTTTKKRTELESDEAKKYWLRLEKAGFVDANGALMPETTRKQAMYIAELFAERLGIKSKWKTFEQQWSISNLAQEKWDMQETGSMPSRSKEIDKIFED